jgi:hypothetical protein
VDRSLAPVNYTWQDVFPHFFLRCLTRAPFLIDRFNDRLVYLGREHRAGGRRCKDYAERDRPAAAPEAGWSCPSRVEASFCSF